MCMPGDCGGKKTGVSSSTWKSDYKAVSYQPCRFSITELGSLQKQPVLVHTDASSWYVFITFTETVSFTKPGVH